MSSLPDSAFTFEHYLINKRCSKCLATEEEIYNRIELRRACHVKGNADSTGGVTTLKQNNDILSMLKEMKIKNKLLSFSGTYKGEFCDMLFNQMSELVKNELLYIRDCYDPLFDLAYRAAIESDLRVFISGVPGQGKTAFRNYFLFKLVEEIKSLLKIFLLGELGQILLFTFENSIIVSCEMVPDECFQNLVFSISDSGAEYFILYDASNGQLGRTKFIPSFRNIVFTSPNNELIMKSYKQMPDINRLLMPLWTINEIKDMWFLKHHSPLSDVQLKLIKEYGCLPRLLEFTTPSLIAHIQDINSSLKKLAKNDWTPDRISHSCIFLFNSGDPRLEEYYYYTNKIENIGTNYMRSLVVEYCKNLSRKWYSAISNSDIPPRVVGSIFEAGVIDTVNKYTCTLAIRSLENDNSGYDVQIHTVPTPTINFDSIGEIKVDTCIGLFVPNDPNFKALDAIWIGADHIDVWQMTISKSHNIVNGFSDSLEHLKNFPQSKINKIRFIFVVDNCNTANNFQKIPGWADDIRQYSGMLLSSTFSEEVEVLEEVDSIGSRVKNKLKRKLEALSNLKISLDSIELNN